MNIFPKGWLSLWRQRGGSLFGGSRRAQHPQGDMHKFAVVSDASGTHEHVVDWEYAKYRYNKDQIDKLPPGTAVPCSEEVIRSMAQRGGTLLGGAKPGTPVMSSISTREHHLPGGPLERDLYEEKFGRAMQSLANAPELDGDEHRTYTQAQVDQMRQEWQRSVDMSMRVPAATISTQSGIEWEQPDVVVKPAPEPCVLTWHPHLRRMVHERSSSQMRRLAQMPMLPGENR